MIDESDQEIRDLSDADLDALLFDDTPVHFARNRRPRFVKTNNPTPGEASPACAHSPSAEATEKGPTATVSEEAHIVGTNAANPLTTTSSPTSLNIEKEDAGETSAARISASSFSRPKGDPTLSETIHAASKNYVGRNKPINASKRTPSKNRRTQTRWQDLTTEAKLFQFHDTMTCLATNDTAHVSFSLNLDRATETKALASPNPLEFLKRRLSHHLRSFAVEFWFSKHLVTVENPLERQARAEVGLPTRRLHIHGEIVYHHATPSSLLGSLGSLTDGLCRAGGAWDTARLFRPSTRLRSGSVQIRIGNRQCTLDTNPTRRWVRYALDGAETYANTLAIQKQTRADYAGRKAADDRQRKRLAAIRKRGPTASAASLG